MVFDHLANAELYYPLHKNFEKAFTYLKQTDLTALIPGTYSIDNDDVYAIVKDYDTKPMKSGKWESHKEYIDIQFVCGGSEKMGYAEKSSMREVEYIAEKEQLVLAGEGQFFIMVPNTFAVFFPSDAHMPCMENGTIGSVHKIIVKVRL